MRKERLDYYQNRAKWAMIKVINGEILGETALLAFDYYKKWTVLPTIHIITGPEDGLTLHGLPVKEEKPCQRLR